MLDQIDALPKLSSSIKNNKVSGFFDKSDMQSILENTKSLVDDKGKKYFLRVSEDANINRVGNNLKIILPLEIEE